MGLDMYLTAEKYNWNMGNDSEVFEKVKDLFPTSKSLGKGKSVRFEVMYWRKANQIHNWFVKNVQDGEDDCREYEVSTEQLSELVDLCKKVLANKELAHELLPNVSGFFFGSQEYNEYYFSVLQETVDALEPLLNVTDFYFSYRSSW